MAEILNVTDRATERILLENLAQEDPDLVEEIRRLMFVFEDILQIQRSSDIQTVLKNVETRNGRWRSKAPAKSSSRKILGNMSARAAEMLREEMEFLGPVKLSAVEQMQQQIVDVIRRLEDAGEITRGGDAEEEQFIS